MTFTKTQQRILDKLSDGRVYKAEELVYLLPDNLCDINAVQAHISDIRPKLRETSRDIIHQRGKGYYLVRYPIVRITAE